MFYRKITLIFLLFSITLSAEVTDKFKLKIGSMYVSTYETDMQIGKVGFPLGAKISTKDQLGLDNDTAVLRIDGFYRFTNKHSIDFSYFGVKSSGNKHIDGELEWDGHVLSDFRANSYFNMSIYKINYGYSFYHNDKVELALNAGLHITTIELGLSAYGKVDGVEGEKFASGASITAPLPVVGFEGEYTVIPNKFYASYKSEYLYLQFDIYKGAFVSNAIALEYRFLENYGLGVGYSNYTILVDMEDGDKRVEIENTLSGVSVYLSYVY